MMICPHFGHFEVASAESLLWRSSITSQYGQVRPIFRVLRNKGIIVSAAMVRRSTRKMELNRILCSEIALTYLAATADAPIKANSDTDPIRPLLLAKSCCLFNIDNNSGLENGIVIPLR
jgi:hypothetical protein